MTEDVKFEESPPAVLILFTFCLSPALTPSKTCFLCRKESLAHAAETSREAVPTSTARHRSSTTRYRSVSGRSQASFPLSGPCPHLFQRKRLGVGGKGLRVGKKREKKQTACLVLPTKS